MTQFLPPNLLALFAPRDPVPYLPPADKLTHEKKRQPYSGIADFLDYFEVRLFLISTKLNFRLSFCYFIGSRRNTGTSTY